MNQYMNQSIYESISQSIYESVNQYMNQSKYESVNFLAGEWMEWMEWLEWLEWLEWMEWLDGWMDGSLLAVDNDDGMRMSSQQVVLYEETKVISVIA